MTNSRAIIFAISNLTGSGSSNPAMSSHCLPHSWGKLHDAGIFRIQVVLSFAALLGTCLCSDMYVTTCYNLMPHRSTQAVRAERVARSTSISHRSLTIRTRPRGLEENTVWQSCFSQANQNERRVRRNARRARLASEPKDTTSGQGPWVMSSELLTLSKTPPILPAPSVHGEWPLCVCVCMCIRKHAGCMSLLLQVCKFQLHKPMIYISRSPAHASDLALLENLALRFGNLGKLKPCTCAEPQESSFLEIFSRRGIELQNPWIKRHTEVCHALRTASVRSGLQSCRHADVGAAFCLPPMSHART